MGVSVLILTLNEEANLPRCLASVAWSDDIVVLDSCSADRTVEIAREFPNVRVFKRPFDTEWKQRNHGLHEIAYKHEWVYICDADERMPADLVREVAAVIEDTSLTHVAYRLRFRNYFMGRWIKRSSGYPVWIIRLVRPKLVTYEQRETNVHPLVEGTVGELRGHFDHYSFSNGLVHWFSKHDFYSTREAMEGIKVDRASVQWRTMLCGDPMARRRAMKNLSYLVPCRSLLRFVHSYFIRGGILDGRAGFHYCCMIAMYEYWIALKMCEQRDSWRQRGDEVVRRMLAEVPK